MKGSVVLTLTMPATQFVPEGVVVLEHSLVSLAKWEAVHEKPFFSKEPMDADETLSYIRCMITNDDFPKNYEARLTNEHFLAINEYINSKQTATWFRQGGPEKKSSEVVTAELIYYWLVSFRIPFNPTETWHLNRLMTLIQICSVKQEKPKKMSRAQAAEQQRRLNAERRQQSGSSG